jgi:Fanconi-associated nuclease 1
LEQILEELRQGRGPERLERERAARRGETIAGLRWELFGEDGGAGLLRLCAALPGPALAELMQAFVEDWSGAQGGLPDLCILPGPPVVLPEASPGQLPEGLLFAEVKGPGDQLRDEQRVWLHRLLRVGVQVELWRVEAAPVLEAGPTGPEPRAEAVS